MSKIKRSFPHSYTNHSRWSDPGFHTPLLDAVDTPIALLPDLVAGLLMHPVAAAGRGLEIPSYAEADKELRQTDALLALLHARDARPLAEPRAHEQRAFVVCRHFALLAAAILRQRGVEARLRVGFADYFTSGFWEDHWVCEYRTGGDRWRLLDPELDARTRRDLGLTFDPVDVPRDRFIVAGSMWPRLRKETLDAATVGVSAVGVQGLWFAASSLLRDLACLKMQEMLPWDYWGGALHLHPAYSFTADELNRFDTLADALIDDFAPLQSPEEVARAAERFGWAVLDSSVLSYGGGTPQEMAV